MSICDFPCTDLRKKFLTTRQRYWPTTNDFFFEEKDFILSIYPWVINMSKTDENTNSETLFIGDATVLLQRIVKPSSMRIMDNVGEVAQVIFDTPCFPGCNNARRGIYESPSIEETTDEYSTPTKYDM